MFQTQTGKGRRGGDDKNNSDINTRESPILQQRYKIFDVKGKIQEKEMI